MENFIYREKQAKEIYKQKQKKKKKEIALLHPIDIPKYN